jgi:hypothetical protein
MPATANILAGWRRYRSCRCGGEKKRSGGAGLVAYGFVELRSVTW